MSVNQEYKDIQILVVDDEPDIRDASERILSRAGYRVLTAERGDKALEIINEDFISIVLLDLKMPGMDGMEVLQEIRRVNPEILVIIITGYATVETAIDAMKAGAYDFIPKPFEPDQLRIVVNRATENIKLRRDAERLERQRNLTLADLDTEKSRVKTIVESLPDGLMVTNAEGVVVMVNHAFARLFSDNDELATGRPIEDYIKDKELCRMIREISEGRHLDFEDIPDYEFSISEHKYLLARAKPVIGENKVCLGAVINLIDITEFKILDRLKSEFVAKVSHELRSPLSTIHEQLALVIKDIVGSAPEQNQRLLARAKEKTKGLISLIGDLLDLSRIEEGQICNQPRPVSLEDVLKSVVDFLQIQAKSKEQTLELVITEELPSVIADPLALESVFGNLITNAINYTQSGGNIRVEADVKGINIRVKVIDNGFGIEERYLDKIFERFFRVKDEKTRFITGTGLGLSIVKGLVDSLGGMIDVESAPGKGSVFTVLIPSALK